MADLAETYHANLVAVTQPDEIMTALYGTTGTMEGDIRAMILAGADRALFAATQSLGYNQFGFGYMVHHHEHGDAKFLIESNGIAFIEAESGPHLVPTSELRLATAADNHSSRNNVLYLFGRPGVPREQE